MPDDGYTLAQVRRMQRKPWWPAVRAHLQLVAQGHLPRHWVKEARTILRELGELDPPVPQRGEPRTWVRQVRKSLQELETPIDPAVPRRRAKKPTTTTTTPDPAGAAVDVSPGPHR